MAKTENATLICGLIMPAIPSEQSTQIREMLTHALNHAKFNVKVLNNTPQGKQTNDGTTNIYNSDLVICDISGGNPNVSLELSLRLAFDKPTLIIKNNETLESFGTSPTEHLIYPVNLTPRAILDFSQQLNEVVNRICQTNKGKTATQPLHEAKQDIPLAGNDALQALEKEKENNIFDRIFTHYISQYGVAKFDKNSDALSAVAVSALIHELALTPETAKARVNKEVKMQILSTAPL